MLDSFVGQKKRRTDAKPTPTTTGTRDKALRVVHLKLFLRIIAEKRRVKKGVAALTT
jgi:hypothetical protein